MSQPKPLTASQVRLLEHVAASGAEVPMTQAFASRILGAIAHERQRVERVLAAGQRLSNAAFNISQKKPADFSETDRASLDAGWRAWDESKKQPPAAARKRAATKRTR